MREDMYPACSNKQSLKPTRKKIVQENGENSRNVESKEKRKERTGNANPKVFLPYISFQFNYFLD